MNLHYKNFFFQQFQEEKNKVDLHDHSEDEVRDYKAAFDDFDKDKSGKIDHSELKVCP